MKSTLPLLLAFAESSMMPKKNFSLGNQRVKSYGTSANKFVEAQPRNALCACGSGKKHKKCCWNKLKEEEK